MDGDVANRFTIIDCLAVLSCTDYCLLNLHANQSF